MVGHNGEHGPTHVAKSGAEVRRAEIAQRYLRGETTIREFAAEYGVSTTTIESDLQILRLAGWNHRLMGSMRRLPYN